MCYRRPIQCETKYCLIGSGNVFDISVLLALQTYFLIGFAEKVWNFSVRQILNHSEASGAIISISVPPHRGRDRDWYPVRREYLTAERLVTGG